MRRTGIATLVGVLAVAAGVIGPTPAQAHEICINKFAGGTSRGVACNRAPSSTRHTDNYVDGCDRSPDGYRVRAWQSYKGVSGGAYPGNYDPNGADPGCANEFTNGFALDADRICIEVVGCSGYLLH